MQKQLKRQEEIFDMDEMDDKENIFKFDFDDV